MNSKDFKKLLLKDQKIKQAFTDAERNEAYKIGREIKQLRIENGWTQKEFGEKIGTKQPGVARIENGGESPNNITLEKIAKVTKTILVRSHFAKSSNNALGSFDSENFGLVLNTFEIKINNLMANNSIASFKEDIPLNKILSFNTYSYCAA